MARAPAVENDLILSLLPAGPGHRRLALAVSLVSLAFFVAAAPFAKVPLAQVPAFLPFYQSALLMIDAITALLLFGQARVTGSRALLVLACGYVFTALITLAHLLTFPAVFSPTGLLGAGPQSTAWLYMFWHGGFPLVVVAYAFLKGDARKRVAVNRNSIFAGLLAAGLAVTGFTLLATLGHDLLPALILQNRYTAALPYVVGVVWALPAIVAAVLWLRRPHSVLDLWLLVVMLAWVFDLGLSAVLNAGRYDLGFYAGRVYGLLAASFVLMVLLFEQVVMYTRLLEARTRERSNIQELGVANADIAARKRAEAELRENEWRLRYATESARLTYVEVDLVRGAARTPENFASVMGYAPPPEQEADISAGTRILLEHVIPQDRPLVNASHEEFASGKPAGKLEYRVLGDDKVQRWIETRWSVQLGPDGKALKSFATNLDITERRNAQEASHENEQRYRTLFSSMDEGYCVIEIIPDENGKAVDFRYLEVNPSFEKLTGLHGALGKRIRDFVPDLEEYWFETYGKVALTGEPVRFLSEAKPMNRWFDLYAFRIGGPESRKVAVLFSNVTERRKAEEALADLQRRRDEALTKELRVATADIAARRVLLRRLAQVEEDERRAIHREMHDRIGQDLASAKLNIDLVRSTATFSAATSVRLEAARDLVHTAIDNSRNIMADLRPPGLDEHGLTVALELYAEEVAKHHSISVTVHGIELGQRLPRLVETTFFRITQEAISNLAKHAHARKVDISLYEEGREVRLTIADDGSGFDVTRLPEAGRYGFQIMRERAEAVNARLEVESTPGRGTRITAVLERAA